MKNKTRKNGIGSIKKAHRRHSMKALSKYILGGLAIVMILTAGVKVSYDLNAKNTVATSTQIEDVNAGYTV